MVNRMKPYKINLNIENASVSETILGYIDKASFIQRLCLIEGHIENSVPFDLFIFDDSAGSEQEIQKRCIERMRLNANALFIHIAVKPYKSNSCHLIGITEEMFMNNFSRVLGFCFLTHCMRNTFVNLLSAAPSFKPRV